MKRKVSSIFRTVTASKMNSGSVLNKKFVGWGICVHTRSVPMLAFLRRRRRRRGKWRERGSSNPLQVTDSIGARPLITNTSFPVKLRQIVSFLPF